MKPGSVFVEVPAPNLSNSIITDAKCAISGSSKILYHYLSIYINDILKVSQHLIEIFLNPGHL